MRRLPFVLAVSAALAALSVGSPVFAHVPDSEEDREACPAPEVVHDYDSDRYTVYATLVASGCPTREQREFSFSAWISRVDDRTGEGHGRVVGCGPFRSSSDVEAGEPTPVYSCEIDLSIPHPPAEAAHYQVEVT